MSANLRYMWDDRFRLPPRVGLNRHWQRHRTCGKNRDKSIHTPSPKNEKFPTNPYIGSFVHTRPIYGGSVSISN